MRLIDADALWMDVIHSMDYCDDILEFIERQPTIEPERGEWIVHFNDLFPAESTEECSICHAEQLINGNDDNFCPNCGARMEGER